jgi:hypothetical protein
MTDPLVPLDPNSAPEPDKKADVQNAFDTARYGKQLEAWHENWKQDATAANAEVAAEVDRVAAETAARVDIDAAALKVHNDAQAVQLAVTNAREDTDDANEFALLTALHAAYIATTQSSLDRALTRLNVFTAAIGAVTGIYTTMIGLSYALPSATDADGIPLDYSAFIPVMFLGTALVLVTIYAALFRKHREDMVLLPAVSDGQMIEQRLVTFMDWCNGGVLARRWALYGGILSFGLGVATLPMAFVSGNGVVKGIVFGLGYAAVIAVSAFFAYREAHESAPADTSPEEDDSMINPPGGQAPGGGASPVGAQDGQTADRTSGDD